MTSVKIVDASALAAVLFGEPEAQEVVEKLAGAKMIAPTLLPYEIASVGLKKMRRYPELREALQNAMKSFSRLDITYATVDIAQVLQLAEETRMTSYDAAYLWLAQRMNADLVSLDKQLLAASTSKR